MDTNKKVYSLYGYSDPLYKRIFVIRRLTTKKLFTGCFQITGYQTIYKFPSYVYIYSTHSRTRKIEHYNIQVYSFNVFFSNTIELFSSVPPLFYCSSLYFAKTDISIFRKGSLVHYQRSPLFTGWRWTLLQDVLNI